MMSRLGSELPEASQLTKRLFYLIQQLLIDKHEVDFEISRTLIEGKCMLLAECKRYSVSLPAEEPIPFSIKLPLEEVEAKVLIGTYFATFNGGPMNMAAPIKAFEQSIPRIAQVIVNEIDRQIRDELTRRFMSELKELTKNTPLINIIRTQPVA